MRAGSSRVRAGLSRVRAGLSRLRAGISRLRTGLSRERATLVSSASLPLPGLWETSALLHCHHLHLLVVSTRYTAHSHYIVEITVT